jgi:hypothetical protein
MAARVSNKVGLETDPHNFLLMHAMGPNVAGVSCKNLSAINFEPTAKPKKMVTVLIKAFCVVSLNRSTTRRANGSPCF